VDNKINIQLGSTKNKNSIDVDTYTNIELANNQNEILEYNINNILSITEVFEAERQSNEVYRIYGGMEYLSLLNGMSKNYNDVSDFFTPYYCGDEGGCDFKNIYDDFVFYLVKPSNNYTKLNDDISHVRWFDVVATPQEFNLFNAGFSKNIFGDEKHIFTFNNDFDVSGVVDAFDMPIVELFLYAVYNKSTTGNGIEKIYGSSWTTANGDTIYNEITPQPLNIGDRIYGDRIEYNKAEFTQTVKTDMNYKITTPYKYDSVVRKLWWEYNPLIPFRLRYFSNELSRDNVNTSSYDQATRIPSYATKIDDEKGNVVWRNIMEQGYIDPITGVGVDYPFVNKKRYLFTNIILSIKPDLSDYNTRNVFNEIKFDEPTLVNTNITGNLNDVGKPCR